MTVPGDDASANKAEGSPRYAKFTISDPTPEHILIPKQEESTNGLPRVHSKSRFKVALVEFSTDPPSDNCALDLEPTREDNKGSGRSRGRGRKQQESVTSNDNGSTPPTSPNVMDPSNSHSYDTHNLKTFGHNTLETLPHLDHYRNLLSATGNIRKRPTLLELHELEKVSGYGISTVVLQFQISQYTHIVIFC